MPRSLSQIVDFQYDEIARSAEDVASEMEHLAQELQRKALAMRAVAADPRSAHVPILHQNALSEQADRRIQEFRKQEAALKMVLRVERNLEA